MAAPKNTHGPYILEGELRLHGGTWRELGRAGTAREAVLLIERAPCAHPDYSDFRILHAGRVEFALVDGRPRHYLRLTGFKQVGLDDHDLRAIAARRASVEGARKGGRARAKKMAAKTAERDKEIARERMAGKTLGAIAKRRRLPKSTVADAAKRGRALIV